MTWRGLINQYREFLPVGAEERIITLNEGNTPLIPAEKLSLELGLEVYLKYEGANPTGSFKDRGMTMAMTKALARGARAVICASTGNTSASAAAYAARAGLSCWVVVPAGAVALGKLSQALVHGARVVAIRGNFDEGLAMVRQLAERHAEVELVNSVNPYRLQGQKTAALEVCDQLGDAPDYLAIPVGNAGNISAYWMGFKEYREAKRSSSVPQMLGFQAAGAAPLVKGAPVEKPETIATAIRIGNPASWHLAMNAVRESSGLVDAVADDEILEAYHDLARREGVFCEPASAASVAGLRKVARAGRLRRGAMVVCILTGNGLKDPERAIKSAGAPAEISPSLRELEDLMGLQAGSGSNG